MSFPTSSNYVWIRTQISTRVQCVRTKYDSQSQLPVERQTRTPGGWKMRVSTRTRPTPPPLLGCCSPPTLASPLATEQPSLARSRRGRGTEDSDGRSGHRNQPPRVSFAIASWTVLEHCFSFYAATARSQHISHAQKQAPEKAAGRRRTGRISVAVTSAPVLAGCRGKKHTAMSSIMVPRLPSSQGRLRTT